MTDREKTCADRINDEWAHRIEELTRVFRAYQRGSDDDQDQEAEGFVSCEEFNNYGLSFGYVVPGSFTDQREGYWRYQFSWGGPSDELRFFASAPTDDPYRIEYRFMDWGDGACLVIEPEDEAYAVLLDIWQNFVETETTKYTFEEARK